MNLNKYHKSQEKRKKTSSVHPYIPNTIWMKKLDYLLRKFMKLESGANIFPLGHILLYYLCFIAAIYPGVVESTSFLIFLWFMVALLNYSLSIGILHLHTHRKLFVSYWPNRVVEFLLCFPSCLSYPMMRYIHVYMHHRFDNGAGDITSTEGFRSGFKAIHYWLRYWLICQLETIRGLFASSAKPRWRKLRRQYIVDTLGCIAIVTMITAYVDPIRTLVFWHLSLVLVFINIGFFAWLTHAPAFSGQINGSINTANKWSNFLMHNQGFHVIHHLHPGIHWTQIPAHLDVMLDVDDSLIVPYWVTLPSAWRIVSPKKFRNAQYGEKWKHTYQQKKANNQLRSKLVPYFSWI